MWKWKFEEGESSLKNISKSSPRKKDFGLSVSHAGVRMATRYNQNKLQYLKALGVIMLTRVTFLWYPLMKNVFG